ncbi:hypothetical protein N656DRAFT_775412 [Canariomyces notabilis]|uniref:Uncharacterized protein n=1 Tax=Canariomyces notabilis TaxID=2074819 RepID=A0AAN6YWI4_9PEZI|nr:hypothetical protein N656DRAFT_775412 [Canariomyces arenarius]
MWSRTLRTIALGVPLDLDAAIDAPVPEVCATMEERFKNYDMDRVTHVVIQSVHQSTDSDFPVHRLPIRLGLSRPFWHFLGKMVAKAVYDDETELRELNFVAIGRREFVAFTTSMWRAAEEPEARTEAQNEGDKAETMPQATELPPLNVIEVNFKKPQPGQPIELAWTPARGLFTAKIRQWNERRAAENDELHKCMAKAAE